MNLRRRPDRSVAARDEVSTPEQADGHQLQCLDCYAIFESDDRPGRAECDSCGSTETVPW